MLDMLPECRPNPIFPRRLPSSSGLPERQVRAQCMLAGQEHIPQVRDIGLGSPPATWKAGLWATFGRQNMFLRCFVWREKAVVSRFTFLNCCSE